MEVEFHSCEYQNQWTVAFQVPLSVGFPAKNTEVGTIPFSGGSSQLRDPTQVSCNAGRLFAIWSTREAPRIPFLWIPKTKAFCISLPARLASLTSSAIWGHTLPPVPKDSGNYIHFPCSWSLIEKTPFTMCFPQALSHLTHSTTPGRSC